MRLPLPPGLRWWELVPEAVVVGGLGLFAVTERSAASSAFQSRTAITLMVVTAVGWLAARLVLVRLTRWPGLRLVVFALAATGVLAVVVLPAYDDTTVVETLPTAAGMETSATLAPSGPSAPGPSPSTTSPATSTEPADPVALRSSAIHGIDHRASGTAVVYQLPDGSLLVGLEDIDIQPGPDYDVYVVPGAGRESIDSGTLLDDLRGNQGTQYYPVPGAADLDMGTWTVLVWCETFDVPVAGASPA